MELLSRDRTICGGLFAAQRVRNRSLTSQTLLSSGEQVTELLGRLDRVRGVRFLRACESFDFGSKLYHIWRVHSGFDQLHIVARVP